MKNVVDYTLSGFFLRMEMVFLWMRAVIADKNLTNFQDVNYRKLLLYHLLKFLGGT